MLIADRMLKKLARWLRILGISVIYPKTESDEKIMEIAKKKNLALLTMDKPLFRRCNKRGLKCFLVPKGSTESQVAAVLKRFKLKIDTSFPSRTLCPQCNGRLRKVKPARVKGKILEAIRKRYKYFWLCLDCGKVFWEGTHWARIKRTAERIKKLIQ